MKKLILFFIMFMVIFMGVSNTFLLVLEDPVCPHCKSKLHRHKKS